MNQNDLKLEEAIVGTLISSPNLILTASRVKPEHFHQTAIRVVYEAIVSLSEARFPIDITTVISEVKKSGRLELSGGAYGISKLANNVLYTDSLEKHCLILHQLYILREISKLSNEISNAAQQANADPFDLIDRIHAKTSELTNILTDKVKLFGDYFSELVDEINQVLESGVPTGVLTNLKNLDDQTGGWQKGHLIIGAGRPGMGKTAIALSFAKYPAFVQKKPVLIFSVEMTGSQLAGRLAASEASMSSTRINQKSINRLELQSLTASVGSLLDSPLYIDDTPNLSINELRARAKKMHHEKNIELIIVDYLQFLDIDDGNKEREISKISKGLKTLAKELNVPVIALSQLSRKCEDRPGKRPQLSDLRDSGSIEQDADIVMFFFRPAYYGLFENGYEYKNEVLDTRNLLILEIAKGRELKTGELPLKFYGEFMQISNYNYSGSIQSPVRMEENVDFLNPPE